MLHSIASPSYIRTGTDCIAGKDGFVTEYPRFRQVYKSVWRAGLPVRSPCAGYVKLRQEQRGLLDLLNRKIDSIGKFRNPPNLIYQSHLQQYFPVTARRATNTISNRLLLAKHRSSYFAPEKLMKTEDAIDKKKHLEGYNTTKRPIKNKAACFFLPNMLYRRCFQS